ncbi:GNAT family N-acetyltransferase [Paenibacillus sp. CMAA1364]
MEIIYKDTKDIKAEDVSSLFMKSGIKRPYQDLERLDRMIQNADIVITAWNEGVIVGLARALTDYSYCCYLSDLAVDLEFQSSGIGTELIDRVRKQMSDECTLILISAPEALEYYPKVGFERSDKAFIIGRER